MNFQFKKVISSVLSVLFLLAFTIYVLPGPVKAEDRFTVDSEVTYRVQENGDTLVSHDITLENLFSSLYATTYTLNLDNITAQKISASDAAGNLIPLETVKEDQKLKIKLTFPDAVVGQGAKRRFVISYENSNFAIKTGEVWEISIPRLASPESFRNYSVVLRVPASLGQEAYVSPNPSTVAQADNLKIYSFDKQIIQETGVTAGFGEFQVFNFSLMYHLENPLNVKSQVEIALPPDTAFQKMYFTKIEPKPADVYVDGDGNYIAAYKMQPRQRIDVETQGSVQIFASNRSFPAAPKSILDENLKATQYWQSEDPGIKHLGQELQNPKSIYDYVKKNLSYDFSRVQPNAARLGALGAISSPEKAICMEFTDLFIALARAAGIPAREVNGYAYTENKELQPISLVADVLHAWPEYYDSQKAAWIPVDPTWGSTSGVDFFNKLDLRHFTFVIHGVSDTKPYPPGSYKLGPNPQKDVFVSFGKMPHFEQSDPMINIKKLRSIPFFDSVYSYTVYNPGPSTLYGVHPKIYFDDELVREDFWEVLPAFGSFTKEVRIPFKFLGRGMPDNLKVGVIQTPSIINTEKPKVVVNSLVLLFAVFIFLIALILTWLGKINFDAIIVTIANTYAKFTKKSPKGIDKS